MDIPLKAEVHCADRVCGVTTRVIVDPGTNQITHLVVQESRIPQGGAPRSARYGHQCGPRQGPHPADKRPASRAKAICRRRVFTRHEPIPGLPGGWVYDLAGLRRRCRCRWRSSRSLPGRLPSRAGARVEATDGDVGKVDEFLIDPVTGRITHIVLREGILWDKRDVTIPVSDIDRIEDDTVYLKLDKKAIGNLPSTPGERTIGI